MEQKRSVLEKITQMGKGVALAAAVSLAPLSLYADNTGSQKATESKPAVTIPTEEKGEMSPVFLHGKTIDDYFKEFNELAPMKQEALAKSLNGLSPWDTVLLARYVPLDGFLKSLSSFYSTDYKGYLQSLLSESTLDPIAHGPTGDRGLGQITLESEKLARRLYNSEYKFPGPEIKDNILDPYTNLVLSSIIFRKGAEEKVADINALCALYSQGLSGVKLDKRNLYVATDIIGADVVRRVKRFDDIADKMVVFSWISMNKPELIKNIESEPMRRVMENNNGTYDGKTAYGDMITYLNSVLVDDKYSEENRKMFRDETGNISRWINELYEN